MKKIISSLLRNTRDGRKRGFTLIELLIVIGILGILVVAVLLTLNPAEAQRKTRDAKRMKDMNTLVSAVQQFLDNGGTPACTAAAGCTSAGGVTTADGTGWLAVNIAPYLSTLPLDPLNAQTRAAIAAGGTCPTGASTTANVSLIYQVKMNAGGAYEVDVRQESWQNCRNTYNDGGNDNSWAEGGSDLTLF